MIYNNVLDSLKFYEAGKPIELVVREYGIKPDEVIKLASNENPLGCSPLALKAIAQNASLASIYPDDSYFELKTALADKFNVSRENLIIGVGSDQVIDVCVKSVANQNRAVLQAGISFAMYEIYALQAGAKLIKTPSATHDLAQFKEIYQSQKDSIGVIFLCLPNNPLGECLDFASVKGFLDCVSKDTLVVLDGAYQEYAAYKDSTKAIPVAEVINSYENVIYLGTFSKAYGLAGLRVGYGIASQKLMRGISRLRPVLNVGSISAKAAVAALKDDEFLQASLELNFNQMARYIELAKELGIDVINSYTNFITLKIKDSSKLANSLLRRGIIVRDLASYGIDAIRVTIGTDSQNSHVIKAIKDELS